MYKLSLMILTASILSLFSCSVKEEESENFFSRDPFTGVSVAGDIADPDYNITFPEDHFEHKTFDIEWWYLTANLVSDDKQKYGLQWTLFRFRNPNSTSDNTWSTDQIYMAHASVHTLEKHFFTEKYARGGVGNAGNFSDPFQLIIDDWIWKNTNSTNDLFPASLQFSANNESQQIISANLSIDRTGPFILHGENGYSIKSADGNHASHYYSAPFLKMKGSFKITSKTNEDKVINVSGDAWYDHEWTSQLLDDATVGWDWMSLHLENGDKLMAFRMRLNKQPNYITGTYIRSDGTSVKLLQGEIRLVPTSYSKVDTKSLPLRWELSIEKLDIDIRVEAIKDAQWNNATVPYYEGMAEVSGSHKGKGFIELTGYN